MTKPVAIDYTDIANRVQVITGRSVFPSTVEAILNVAGINAPEPPADASVSERARALLASVYEADGLHGIAQGFRNGENTDSRALRALEQALTQQRGCVTCGGRGEIGGHVGQTAETFDYVTEPCPECTTPQPGAEALRELVQRWRTNGHPYVSDCANELESLLARGG